ncbi:MAG TPA: PilN domain-containing protein [Paenibacillaceae bacterium]
MSETVVNSSPLEINLLQIDEELEGEAHSPVKPLLVLAVLVVGVGAVGWLWNDAVTQSRRLEAELARVNGAISEREARQVKSGSTVPVSAWTALPDTLRKAVPKATGVLDGLRRLMPREANLTSLTYTEDGSIRVAGRFATVEQVVAFMLEAEESPDFSEVRLTSLNNRAPAEDAEPGTLPVVEAGFELTYTPSAGADKGGGG